MQHESVSASQLIFDLARDLAGLQISVQNEDERGRIVCLLKGLASHEQDQELAGSPD